MAHRSNHFFGHISRLVLVSGLFCIFTGCNVKKESVQPLEKPTLTVMVTSPRMTDWPLKILASGNVAAWQETSIGSEIGGLRLVEVLVSVGDSVKNGQLLARISDASVLNDVVQQTAAVEEAEANLSQSAHNIERARELEAGGSISRQELMNYETQAAISVARLKSSKAMLAAQALKLTYTRITAPEEGIISSRTATAGAVVGTGSELFKLIRKNRLEWRGELRADDLIQIKPNQIAEFKQSNGAGVRGKVRQVAPSVDTGSRTGIVYVDLPANSTFRAGMFVSAVLIQDTIQTLAIPQSAVIVRDGFNYAMRLGPDNKVRKIKLTLGKRQGDLVELLGGLGSGDRIVSFGGSFLNEGDLVQVVDSMPHKNKAIP